MKEEKSELNGKFVTYDNVRGELEIKLTKGFQKADHIGYKCLQDMYSQQKGSTTYVYGDPFSGKSKVWFQALKNTAIQYKRRHVIYSPETGTAEDIYEELICIYAKTMDYYTLSQSDVMQYGEFIRDHFFVIDSIDEDLTFNDLMGHITEKTKEFGKFDTLTIDPLNEVKINFTGDRSDQIMSDILGSFRKFCRHANIHGCIINHTRDRKNDRKKGKAFRDGQEIDIEYYPIPSPNDMLHGPTMWRKGMMIIAVWRPPLGFLDPCGVPYPPNTSIINVQKFKPRGYGRVGIAELFLNLETNEYQEKLGEVLHGPWGETDHYANVVDDLWFNKD